VAGQPSQPGSSPSASSPELPPEAAPAGPVLDKLNAALKQIEGSLDRRDLTDSDLQALREQLDPISDQVAGVIGRLSPRLAGFKARLEELGPSPKADAQATPESPEVTAERAKQQKLYSDTDELLKRARLLSVEAGQTAASITAKRRALFTRSLFTRATSIINPALWTGVWREAPDDSAAAKAAFADWASRVSSQLDGHKLWVLAGTLALILFFFAGMSWLARRVLRRDPEAPDPGRFRKVLAAWWTAIAVAAPPAAAVFLIGLVLQTLDISDAPLEPFIQAGGGAVIRIAAAAGIVLGLFAPGRPNWRLPKLSDRVVEGIVRAGIGLACIVSITRLFEALNDMIGASLTVAVAMRGLAAMLAALVAGAELWRIGTAARVDESLAPDLGKRQDWFDLLRIVAWAVTIVMTVSVLIGYAAFGSFLADQLFWDGGVACLLFMSIVFADEAASAWFKSSTRLGRLMTSLGFNRKSIELTGILVSGVARLALFVVAAALVLAPWGLQSSDVLSDFSAAFFGFKVGEVTISPSSVIISTCIFALSLAAIHGVLRWVDVKLLPQTSLDFGLRVSIVKTLSYAGFVLAAGFALGYLGLNFEKLAIVAGALSVGIGFGLQSIVNNFVSGLVLLWERAVRVGDWIVVGGDQGFVRRINVRSTEIETFDRSQVIIPNANLITGVVTNLVRNDRTGRLVIPLTVAGAADPEKVREVLTEIAKSHELVLKIPAPQVLFTGMSGSALSFELRVFLRDVETIFRVKSDLHFAIFRRFKEEKFFDMPGPDTTRIEIAGFETLSGLLAPASALSPLGQREQEGSN
jgi:small-conductance mechanosensitive channel